MSTRKAAWDIGEAAAASLAPESGLVARMDSSDFGKSLAAAMRRAAVHPAALAAANGRFASRLAMVGPAALARWFGAETELPVPVGEKDKRFAHGHWQLGLAPNHRASAQGDHGKPARETPVCGRQRGGVDRGPRMRRANDLPKSDESIRATSPDSGARLAAAASPNAICLAHAIAIDPKSTEEDLGYAGGGSGTASNVRPNVVCTGP